MENIRKIGTEKKCKALKIQYIDQFKNLSFIAINKIIISFYF